MPSPLTLFDQHLNLATSLVASAPSPAISGTSLQVTAGEGAYFPSLTNFDVTIHPADQWPSHANAEIVRVSRSGDTFTITRAQGGSSAKLIAVGWRISQTVNVKSFTDIERHNWIDVTDPQYGAKGDAVTDDTAAIQAAINAMPSSGGTIWLPGGRSTVYSITQLHFRSNMTFISDLATLKRASGSGAPIIAALDEDAGLSNIVLRGVVFDGNGTNDNVVSFPNNCSNVLIEYCEWQNFGSGWWLLFNDGTATTLPNDLITIRRCKVVGNSASYNAGEGGIILNPSRVRIEENYFEKFGTVKLEPASGATANIYWDLAVRNNLFYDNGQSSVLIRPNGATIIKDVVVTGNEFRQVGLIAGKGAVVHEQAVGSGGTVTHSVIANNIVKYWGRASGGATAGNAITVGSSTMIGEDIVIANNILDCSDLTGAAPPGQTSGIVVLGSSGTHIKDVVIIGNIVKYTGIWGILVEYADCVITNNIVVNAMAVSTSDRGSGIYLSFGVANSIINNNKVYNTGAENASGSPYAGIGTERSNTIINNVMIGNRCFDDRGTPFQVYGIRLGVVGTTTDQPQEITISDCDLDGNVTGAIGLNNGTTERNYRIINNRGYNPQGTATIVVGASPFTYTAGATPEVIYIRGGTVSDISKDGRTVFVASPATIFLGPSESVVVTYSVIPTMEKDRK